MKWFPRAIATASVFAGALLASSEADAADPYVGYVYPAALSAGSTNRLVVGGQFLNGKKVSAWISGDGVEVLDVEHVPSFPFPPASQRKYLQKALELAERGEKIPPVPEKSVADGWRSNSWWSAIGSLDAKSRAIVARDLWVPKNALQAAPSLKQLMLVTVAVAKDAKPGCRQLRVFRPNAISAPRPIEILAMPVAEEPLYEPPRPKATPKLSEPPRLGKLPIAAVGQILPGETDRWILHLDRGERFTATVRGRFYQPYIGDAVPGFFNPVVSLRDVSGREVAFADDFNGMDPDPRLNVIAPETGDYTFEISDRLFRGRADFVYTAEFTHEGLPPPPPATKLPHLVPLKVAQPGVWTFEVRARRLGSPIDPRLTLLDATGRELGRWDDVTNSVHVGSLIQAELDPVVTYDFKCAGDYTLRVDDTCGRRGPAMRCEVEARPARPSFEIFADRSAFILAPGQRQKFTVSVRRRDGFAGSVALVENECLRFEDALVPAGTNVWKVTAVGKAMPKDPKPFEFDILAVGESASGVLGAKVVAADSFEQAFAYQHLVSFGRFWLFPRTIKGRDKNERRL